MKLPDGYDLYSVIDLKTNKKDNLFVTIGSVVIMAVMFIAAYFTKGVYILASIGWVKIIINIVIAFVGSVVYIFLHEATHAAFFKYSTQNAGCASDLKRLWLTALRTAIIKKPPISSSVFLLL